jgi:carbon monoxide dehydrogenase subunit G
MSRFTATNNSEAIVPAERAEIWAVLTDPVLLSKLTPLLRRIDTDGDLWTWHLARISVLGIGISTAFTERMRFNEGRRIDYTHEPPKGANERTGASGTYELSDAKDGTHLAISLTVHVELPLSKLAAPAVVRIMEGTIQRMGERFSTNLLDHLGVQQAARRA